jgi:hypothetical protein
MFMQAEGISPSWQFLQTPHCMTQSPVTLNPGFMLLTSLPISATCPPHS